MGYRWRSKRSKNEAETVSGSIRNRLPVSTPLNNILIRGDAQDALEALRRTLTPFADEYVEGVKVATGPLQHRQHLTATIATEPPAGSG